MKKLFCSVVMLCCIVLNSNADDKKGIIYLDSPSSYQVLSISQNGEWACGGQYDENTETNYGFRWNLLTGKIDQLGVCSASGVSNDGTVVGSYYTSTKEIPAMWKDGEWTDLELPNGKSAWAQAITPDGQYVTGTDYNYKSYIWKNGKIENSITINPVAVNANGTFITYAISPDGQKAGGWSYFHGDNRNPGYWDAADNKFHDLEPDQGGSPWQAVKKFSADSKKALYWGGYHEEPVGSDHYGIHAIYDTETGDVTTIYPMDLDPFNFDLFDMNSDASIVLGYEQDGEGTERAIIWNNGETQLAEDFLIAKGAQFDYDNIMILFRAVAVDGDANTFCILYYDYDYEYHSLIVAFDRNVSMTSPVNLEATQVSGLGAVNLEWEEPLGDKETLTGYNIYRDGEKVNSDVVTTTQYYDKGLANGTYSYAITALYEEGESAASASASVTLSDKEIQAPTQLTARQKGYNTALAIWEGPDTNLAECQYYGDGSSFMDGFGGGDVSFESATRFTAEQMNLYEGYRLTAVSFYPKTEQGSWIVNIYTHNDGKLTLLGSQKVNQGLDYGYKNIVELSRPITLQKDHDLLVGIQTNVTNACYDVQGIYEDHLKIGYTDLLRMVGESDFYSINEAGGTGYDVTWATSALLTPSGVENNPDDIDYYEVTVDGGEPIQTYDNRYTSTLANGNHTIGVAVTYADGRKSKAATTDVTIKADANALQAITPEVTNWGADVTAKWEAPLDDDANALGYCSEQKASKSPSTTESCTEIKARVDFPGALLKSYENYQINALSFYPLSNSTFSLELYEGEELMASADPDEVTLDEWNTISIDPVTILKNKTYRFVVNCYDCPAGESPIAIDGISPDTDYSSYLSAGGEDGWYTISEETGLNGSWLMLINVKDPEAEAFNVDGYDVYVDGEKLASQQSSLVFNTTLPEIDANAHTLRVDTKYAGVQKAVAGNPVSFTLDTTGIEAIGNEEITNNNSPVYNVIGQRVAHPVKGIMIQNGRKIINK